MTIRCLIIDDEPLAARLISSYCNQVPGLEVATLCTSAIEAYAILRQHRIDLLFLDIKMPLLIGTDFLRSLSDPPKVILVTAYREYALDGYELDIVDYLLKPVSFTRFMRAVEKAGRQLVGEWSFSGQSNEPQAGQEPFLYFRVNREMVKVLLNDILFVESRKEYVLLYLEGDKTLMVKQSISSLEKLLSPHQFIRVHRSYMVTARKVRSFNATRILIDHHTIPVGRLYRHQVEQLLKQ
jgi:DNA-binding LytR/AlgR family response regulator